MSKCKQTTQPLVGEDSDEYRENMKAMGPPTAQPAGSTVITFERFKECARYVEATFINSPHWDDGQKRCGQIVLAAIEDYLFWTSKR